MKFRSAKRFLAILCVLVLCLSMGTSVYAATNTCSSVSGNANKTVSFTVNTSKNIFGGTIKLTQEKGTAKYLNWACNYVKKDAYGYYNVTVTRIDGGKNESKEILWKGTKTLSISLKRNAEYRITVSPSDQTTTVFSSLLGGKGAFSSWVTAPTWSTTKTSGVSYCK
jgi:hypothetical protein